MHGNHVFDQFKKKNLKKKDERNTNLHYNRFSQCDIKWKMVFGILAHTQHTLLGREKYGKMALLEYHNSIERQTELIIIELIVFVAIDALQTKLWIEYLEVVCKKK